MMTYKSDGNYLLINFYLPSIKKPVHQAPQMHTLPKSVLDKISKSGVNTGGGGGVLLSFRTLRCTCDISKYLPDITKSKIFPVFV